MYYNSILKFLGCTAAMTTLGMLSLGAANLGYTHFNDHVLVSLTLILSVFVYVDDYLIHQSRISKKVGLRSSIGIIILILAEVTLGGEIWVLSFPLILLLFAHAAIKNFAHVSRYKKMIYLCQLPLACWYLAKLFDERWML